MISTYKSFTNHAHWVIGEPGWLETADDVSEWLESTTTSKTPDVHGSTNVAVIWISKSDLFLIFPYRGLYSTDVNKQGHTDAYMDVEGTTIWI